MEISAFVLTLGEASTDKALEALERQTVPLKTIVTISGVTPLSRALKDGVARMHGDCFIQCDSDMILDPDCVEIMSAHLADDVGVVVGMLRDRIIGVIRGVKLFRRECFDSVKFPDTVTPGSDLIKAIQSHGWRRAFATRGDNGDGGQRDTFGAHEPDYTPDYTFHRFRRLGTRMRSRGVFSQCRALLKKLGKSSHPMAPVAIIGLSRGLFDDELDPGSLGSNPNSAEFEMLERYMSGLREGGDIDHEA